MSGKKIKIIHVGYRVIDKDIAKKLEPYVGEDLAGWLPGQNPIVAVKYFRQFDQRKDKSYMSVIKEITNDCCSRSL